MSPALVIGELGVPLEFCSIGRALQRTLNVTVETQLWP